MRLIFIFLVIGLLQISPMHAGENRVVVITGASRGVGLATALYLAEKGYSVYGTVRESSKLPPLTTDNLHFVPVDLKDEKSVHSAVAAILKKEGHIDILINNAGFAIVGPSESLSEEEIREQMEVNFFAPVRFIQAVLPSMRTLESGHIINISSINAIYTPPFGGFYAASKAALESFSESLCIEVKPYNIAVSIVEPGLLTTHISILMGTREVPNNPYQNITDLIRTSLAKRNAHPELLTPSQTPEEIAELLFGIIQDPNPKLRYQTSEDAIKQVSKKLLDLTGELYVNEMVEDGLKDLEDSSP